MSSSIQVSFLMPVYNGIENYPDGWLEGAAIEYDSHQPISTELIIVDDGSTDNTEEVIRSTLDGRENYTILSNEENRGIAYSLQRAYQAAKGDYCIIQTLRSWYTHTGFMAMFEALENNPGVCFAYGNTVYWYVDKDDEIGRSVEYRAAPFSRMKFLAGFPSCYGFMWRTSPRRAEFTGYLNKEGRFIDISDRDFLMQLIFWNKQEGLWVDEVTLNYLYHGRGQMTSLVHKYHNDIKQIFESRFGNFGAVYK